MAFVRNIEAGILDGRLDAKDTDEISGLARGLNTMAQSLKESRNALEEAEHLYRGLFENAVEGIFVTDPEGIVLNANPASASLVGYASPAEVVGRNVSLIIPPQGATDCWICLKPTERSRTLRLSFTGVRDLKGEDPSKPGRTRTKRERYSEFKASSTTSRNKGRKGAAPGGRRRASVRSGEA